jgi:phage tail protein X
MAFTGGLEKMLVKAYADSGFHREVGSFQVWINPAEYSHVYRVCYNDRQAQGSAGASPDFDKVASDEVTLQLVFDGTGVVPGPVPGLPFLAPDGVAGQVEAFRKLVFSYDGNIHSPRFLRLIWGTMLFSCRLADLSLSYTLFKPDGTPLRARAEARFLGYTDPVELARMSRKSSPDLTHVRTVREGDTLPLLCWEVYGSSAWYPRVARANGLAGFRDLPAGLRLVFPPLRDVPA